MSNSYPQIAQIYTDDNFKNQHNLQNQREKNIQFVILTKEESLLIVD
jgi:hypothetical protein